MEACPRPHVSCFINRNHQRKKDIEEIEKIEKYSQKKVKIVNNSLCVCVCVCVCVLYLCIIVYGRISDI